eukprot:scaffold38518_cov54-Phaeocystis_antarctica.AAC.4
MVMRERTKFVKRKASAVAPHPLHPLHPRHPRHLSPVPHCTPVPLYTCTPAPLHLCRRRGYSRRARSLRRSGGSRGRCSSSSSSSGSSSSRGVGPQGAGVVVVVVVVVVVEEWGLKGQVQQW